MRTGTASASLASTKVSAACLRTAAEGSLSRLCRSDGCSARTAFAQTRATSTVSHRLIQRIHVVGFMGLHLFLLILCNHVSAAALGRYVRLCVARRCCRRG